MDQYRNFLKGHAIYLERNTYIRNQRHKSTVHDDGPFFIYAIFKFTQLTCHFPSRISFTDGIIPAIYHWTDSYYVCVINYLIAIIQKRINAFALGCVKRTKANISDTFCHQRWPSDCQYVLSQWIGDCAVEDCTLPLALLTPFVNSSELSAFFPLSITTAYILFLISLQYIFWGSLNVVFSIFILRDLSFVIKWYLVQSLYRWFIILSAWRFFRLVLRMQVGAYSILYKMENGHCNTNTLAWQTTLSCIKEQKRELGR